MIGRLLKRLDESVVLKNPVALRAIRICHLSNAVRAAIIIVSVVLSPVRPFLCPVAVFFVL